MPSLPTRHPRFGGAYPHYYRGRCLGVCTTSLLRMAWVALALAREGWRSHPMQAIHHPPPSPPSPLGGRSSDSLGITLPLLHDLLVLRTKKKSTLPRVRIVSTPRAPRASELCSSDGKGPGACTEYAMNE